MDGRFAPRAEIENFGLLPSVSRGVVDQDQVARPVDFSLPHDEVVEVDGYFELSPYGLRGACLRQPVAPLMGASCTHCGDDASFPCTGIRGYIYSVFSPRYDFLVGSGCVPQRTSGH